MDAVKCLLAVLVVAAAVIGLPMLFERYAEDMEPRTEPETMDWYMEEVVEPIILELCERVGDANVITGNHPKFRLLLMCAREEAAGDEPEKVTQPERKT